MNLLEWRVPREDVQALVARVQATGRQAALRSTRILVWHGHVWAMMLMLLPKGNLGVGVGMQSQTTGRKSPIFMYQLEVELTCLGKTPSIPAARTTVSEVTRSDQMMAVQLFRATQAPAESFYSADGTLHLQARLLKLR